LGSPLEWEEEDSRGGEKQGQKVWGDPKEWKKEKNIRLYGGTLIGKKSH